MQGLPGSVGNSWDSLNCCFSIHTTNLPICSGGRRGDVLVPEKRQDYPSNHGTRTFRSDQLGAWKLRVSICVDKLGFLGVEGSRTLRKMLRPTALSSLGEAPGYATLWIQKFVPKQRIRIAKCLIEQQNGFFKNNWLHFSKQQNYIVIQLCLLTLIFCVY